MKRILLLALLYIFAFSIPAKSQVSTNPQLATHNSSLTINFDASKGNKGLENFSGPIYAHTGVITNKSKNDGDWKYVVTNWAENTEKIKLKSLGNNIWQLKVDPNIRSYYDVPASEDILKIALVFRSADGSKTGKTTSGSDIFITVHKEGLQLSFTTPSNNSVLAINETSEIQISANSSDKIELYLNNTKISESTNSELSYTYTASTIGNNTFKATASNASEEKSIELNIYVRKSTQTISIPEGLKRGVNYINNTSAYLVLYAPHKDNIFVLGDFNNWSIDNNFLMNKDGDYFWIRLNNLIKGKEYIYQYYIDGSIKIADPYTEKISDPWNDKYINEDTYPALIEYPEGKTQEIASVLQTGQTNFVWSDNDFTIANSENLVIYELHLRDFTEEGNLKGATAKLDYLQDLGINTIELMPINEFEGNDSWGYNPSFYFAPDKAYGTKDDYKKFIDECHKRGIAIIIDMVLNHSFGQSPFVRMYFENGKPTSESPWYNEEYNFKNPSAQWGYDFDHTSIETQKLVDSINTHWMKEYHVDGFRFDFTKGFSNTIYDKQSWGSNYDKQRIDILKRMSDAIWAENKKAIVSCEHLSDNKEETELANHGILLWGNANHQYSSAVMGKNTNNKSDLSWTSYKQRGWNDAHIVNYMESHDEERIVFASLEGGASTSNYDTSEINTALERVEMSSALFFCIPGPKLIWQFEELGYDISINENGRTGKKPIKWDYLNNPNRKRLFLNFKALIELRKNIAFTSTNFTMNTSEEVKSINIYHDNMDVIVIANCALEEKTSEFYFNRTGVWYDYFTGSELSISDNNTNITLKAGEYHIYTSKKLNKPEFINPPVADNVDITADNYRIGKTISAEYTFSDIDGDLEGESIFKWYRALNNLGQREELISSASEYQYTLSTDDIGKTIRFSVTPVSKTGDILIGKTVYSKFSPLVDYATAIGDIDEDILSIYPNPTQDYLYIDNTGKYTNASIFDINGKLIKNIQLQDSKNKVFVKDLNRAIYLLILRGENKSYYSFKFMKQ